MNVKASIACVLRAFSMLECLGTGGACARSQGQTASRTVQYGSSRSHVARETSLYAHLDA